MIEVIRDAERRSLNVVPLRDLLAKSDVRFRRAVIGGLIREGFEMDDSLPCLQHPKEILEAIGWLASLDFGPVWEGFHQALLAASQMGILLDIRRRPTPSRRARQRTRCPLGLNLPRHQLAET